jgi:hypothetical protein
LEEISLELEEGKGLDWLRIISGRPLEVDEKWCAYFIDWQTASDRVNWTKLTQIQKRTDLQTVQRSKC